MKKIYIIAGICLLILFGKTNAKENSSEADVRNQISSIIVVYQDKVFEAMFSIAELRSYAILQNDKLSDAYDNKWTPPEDMLDLLNPSDKQELLEAVVNHIAESDDKLFRKKIIRTLRNWCVAELQFRFLTEELGFDLSTIILTIHHIPGSRHIVEKFFKIIAQTGAANKLSPVQEQEAYFDALNLIASISFDLQLRYFSDMYNELAVLTSADTNKK